MTETYLVDAHSQESIDNEQWAYQSFRPLETHVVEFVDLDLASMWPSPQCWVGICAATAWHTPTEVYISRSLSFTPPHWLPLLQYRVRFKMQPCKLIANVEYCIVAKGTGIWMGSSFVWYYVKDHGAYPRGIRGWFDTALHYWFTCPDDDFSFAEFGHPVAPPTPPNPPPDPPPTPPDPPIEKWLIIQRAQIRTETGENMIAYTNVPCHLWLRWTTVTPRTHPRSAPIRGLDTMNDLYFCFDVYNDVEQEEAGDTLQHTFIVEPWPLCELRYFYFHGTINGTSSPSTSPIFTKHPGYPPGKNYFYPDPHPEVTSVDGHVLRDAFGSTWAQLRDGEGTLAESDLFNFGVEIRWQSLPDEYWRLYRGILLFDTSIIPKDAKILRAALRLDVWSLTSRPSGDWAITIVDSNPASNTDLVPKDYQRLGTTPLTDIKDWNDFIEYRRQTFTFTPKGLSAIKPGGITKLGIREYGYDIRNKAPTMQPTAGVFMFFYAADMGGDLRPRLEVDWQ